MSGPVTMALGPFMFRAHGFGFNGLGRKLDTSWAEIETAGRLNAQQWTGPRSDAVTIRGVLFPQEFGGDVTLDAVRMAAKSGLPLMLVSLGGRIFGRHALQKVDDDQEYHNRYGRAGMSAYSLELKRLDDQFSLLSLFR